MAASRVTDPRPYRQAALDLSLMPECGTLRPPTPAEADECDDEPLPDLTHPPSFATDPEHMPRGRASHRLPDDFWQEYHLEWEFRERIGMTPVSPEEFADMRDFADGILVPLRNGWWSVFGCLCSDRSRLRIPVPPMLPTSARYAGGCWR